MRKTDTVDYLLHQYMNDQDNFLEFIGNLEYLRKHKKLTPDAANSILSGVPLTIYAGQEGTTECAEYKPKTDTKTIQASTTTTTPAQGGAGSPDVSGNTQRRMSC